MNQTSHQGSRYRLFRIRNFDLWWGAESLAVLGDTATFIALQWALLSVYDEMIAGLALALAGIPRAAFMVFGGALTDRYSPRTIVIVSNVVRAFVIAGLSMVFFFASDLLVIILLLTFLFGTADAFFFPAQGAFLPRIIPRDLLATGNAVIHGTMQGGRFLGPAAAGLMIAWSAANLAPPSANEALRDAMGSGAVLALVCALLLLAALTATLIRQDTDIDDMDDNPGTEPTTILYELVDGFRYTWKDELLRVLIPIIFVSNILLAGIFTIGLGSYIKFYLGLEATDFGIMMSAMGAGSLVGILLAGVLPHPERPGALWLALASTIGLGMVALLFVDNLFLAASVIGITSVANGYINIMFITWLQLRTPRAYLGRVMSLITLAGLGGEPLSQAVTGLLLKWSIWWTFLVAGTLHALVMLAGTMSPTIRRIGYDADASGDDHPDPLDIASR